MTERHSPMQMTRSTPSADPITVTTHGHALVITLNRPEVRNAIDLPTAEAVAVALDELDERDDLRVGVLTGAGRGFCAGMDLDAFSRGVRPWIGDRGFCGITERGSTKPLIAAVEGFALAGGLEIALACDLIVAATDARLGIPEVSRGLIAAGGGLLRLPQRLPRGIALELALTGDPISGARAYELGLINVASAPGSALTDALTLAARIAENAPSAVATSKRVIHHAADWGDDGFWEQQAPIAERVLASADAHEGARAFIERRPPVWSQPDPPA